MKITLTQAEINEIIIDHIEKTFNVKVLDIITYDPFVLEIEKK